MRVSVVLRDLGYSSRTGVTKGMAGLSVKSLKKNYFLIPLIGTMAFAGLLVLGFSTRMVLKVTFFVSLFLNMSIINFKKIYKSRFI
jgi:hypothetical protein